MANLAIYIHWPFCESKCPYCDFNSHVAEGIDAAAWRDGLLAELRHYGTMTAGRRVGSVFFGGGTPSLMAAETVAALIDAVGDIWGWIEAPEITLEANPSSAEAGRFGGYRAAGVNRLSLGVQSLDPAALEFLGRRHDAAQARRALELAAATFPRHSFDLIYALPEQSAAAWQRQLAEALAFAGDHLSVYQLTVEPGTAFFRDRVAAAETDAAADMFELTRALLAEAGLPAYEVSNHARPGAESRHNLTYWRGGDYVGVGPGAHGRLSIDGGFHATHQIADPARWLARVGESGHATAKTRCLTARERAEEMVITGLRMAEGIDLALFEARGGLALDRVVDPSLLQQCLSGGLLARDGTRLKPTEQGLLRLNAMLAALLAPSEDGGEDGF